MLTVIQNFLRNRKILLQISLLVAVLLLALIFTPGSWLPVRVQCQNTDCALIHPRGGMQFEFSRDVDEKSVEQAWQVEPERTGHWVWQDARHATWFTLSPFASGQEVRMRFQPGAIGQNGERLRQEQTWQAVVRQPQIIALHSIEEGGQELVVFGTDESQPVTRLTQTNGKLVSFAPSPDGERILLVVQNDSNGLDLWMVRRDGSDQHKVLDCASDRCSTPAWSPASEEVAYTREKGGLVTNAPIGVPRIWVLDLGSGKTDALFTNEQKTGYGPEWSPDGQWISIWNSSLGGIEVVDRTSGEIIFLKSSNGDSGCWSADSQRLFYSDLVLDEEYFHNAVLQANLADETVQTILGRAVTGEKSIGYDNPKCHPTEDQLAISVQPNFKITGRKLEFFQVQEGESSEIMNNLSKFPNSYSWTPDGGLFLFQLTIVGGQEADQETWVWEEANVQARLVRRGVKLPTWLP